MKSYKSKIAVIVIALILCGGFVALMVASSGYIANQNKTEQKRLNDYKNTNIGGPFALTDHNGRKITEADYQGQYKLIFFGFTFCPDICPTELKKITNVVDALGVFSEQVQPIFITTDPARDTPEVMRQYVSLYHPKLVGLTGAEAEIDVVMERFKVYSEIIPNEDDAEDYLVSHSSHIYFMDRNNNLLDIFRSDDDIPTIANNIRRTIKNTGS